MTTLLFLILTAVLMLGSVYFSDISTTCGFLPTLVCPSYWKEQAQQDMGQETTNPHILAARILVEVKATVRAVTHLDINTVLSSQGFSITSQELEQLKGISYTEYNMADLVGIAIKPSLYNAFNLLYPRSVPVGTGRWGIYMFINKTTGSLYVGSSIVLGERFRHYWKTHNKQNVRKILADIRTTGITNFNLRIYEFPVELQEMRLLLALEQYYMLTLDPQNNTLYVANGSPGGMAVADFNRALLSVPVYMYLNNVLIAQFSAKEEGPTSMAVMLSVSSNVIATITDTTTLLYETFLLTTKPLEGSTENLMPIPELLEVVEQARAESKSRQASQLSGSKQQVKLIRETDGEVFLFPSVGKATDWLAKEANVKVWKRYLKKHQLSGLPLHGYIVVYL